MTRMHNAAETAKFFAEAGTSWPQLPLSAPRWLSKLRLPVPS